MTVTGHDPGWDITPVMDYSPGAMLTMYKRVENDSLAMPTYKHLPVGEIPQVKHTYAYINTAYPCMNEHQLAIGETTFGVRESLQ
jgi:dipeptidase